jgi:hypothetical protein
MDNYTQQPRVLIFLIAPAFSSQILWKVVPEERDRGFRLIKSITFRTDRDPRYQRSIFALGPVRNSQMSQLFNYNSETRV